ncbi:MAG: AHH domain-containing protein [Gammaproteobacteria bacterium]|nr:AHH domain-containing protein [Gammaproteobacteria bacterium]
MRQVVSPPPVIPSPRPSNPTALELAIHRFEHQAKVYHYEKVKLAKATGQPGEISKARAKLDRDWQHLQRERIRIATHAQLALDLENYRASAQEKTVAMLADEPHHPTRQLARNLTAVGEPKPSLDHDPHHIIMGKGRFLALRMMQVRLSLHLHNMGINDPINGVWLPRTRTDKGHWATPEAPAHKELHGFNYEAWIVRQFRDIKMSKQRFVNRLRDVKIKLQFGGHPADIVQPKNPSWSGE